VASRAERRAIEGVPGYTISADGVPRKWGRIIPIDKGPGGLPVIDVNGVELLLDEVVCRAFFGQPPRPIRGMTVVHFDGDLLNCAVTNLAWRVHPDWITRQRERSIAKVMRPDFLPVRPRHVPPEGMTPPFTHRVVFL
jgi:hypothetical protein